MVILKETESYCDDCRERIPARILLKDEKVIIEKRCREHGVMSSGHMWSDPKDFDFFSRLKIEREKPEGMMIPLTSRCNLNCHICFARAERSEEDLGKDLAFDEIKKIDIEDFRIIKLTGGEPTLRSDLPKIIRYFKGRGKWVMLYSNGIRLADDNFVKRLKKAGLDDVVLQFDTFDPKSSKMMREEDLVNRKLKALANLKMHCIKTSIFAVIMPENLDEIGELVALGRRYNIRGIELSRQIKIGRYIADKEIGLPDIFSRLQKSYGLSKEGFYSTTEFLSRISPLLGIRYLNRCSLINLFLAHRSDVIPIDRIFDLKRFNRTFKDDDRMSLQVLGLLFDQLFLNFFRKREYRILVNQSIRNIFKYSMGNRALMNPFSMVFVNGEMGLDNIDLDIVADCHKRIYTGDDDFKYTTCSHYIKNEKNE